jgi:spore maturation protein CgeB
MKILYIGKDGSGANSKHRADALRRLGHEVIHINPFKCASQNHFAQVLHFKTGYRFMAHSLERQLQGIVSTGGFDIAWVDNGETVSRSCVRMLKSKIKFVVNYNTDDPTGRRDGQRWVTFLPSIPEYDLLVVNREESEREYLERGARRIFREFRTYDPLVHHPVEMTASELEKWNSEVVFVGTWMPERGPFIARLLELGVPLTIRGNRWGRASRYPQVLKAWLGPAVAGREYVMALQSAKICLGLLSEENRDRHTRRSVEIPYIGSVLCAERTDEHQQLYREGSEAVFWSSPEECAGQIHALLKDEAHRQAIATRGRARVIANRLDNDSFVGSVLTSLLQQGSGEIGT